MKLETLKRNAGREARVNGHQLTWGEAYGHPATLTHPEAYSVRGTCKCGCEVTVRQESFSPMDGNALFTRCDRVRPARQPLDLRPHPGG